MAPRERQVIISSLTSKGFVQEDGKDHIVLVFAHQGVIRRVHTKVSRGSGYKDYSDQLLGDMSRQLQVTRKQLNGLIDCNLQGPEYEQILRAKGVIREVQTPKQGTQKGPRASGRLPRRRG